MRSVIEEPVRGTFGDMSFLKLPGVEAIRHLAHADGPLPPIHHLTGLRPTEVSLARVTTTMPVTRWFEDSFGLIWSGIYPLCTDLPISLSLYAGLPAGKFLTTAELSIHYLRPATTASGHLIARGQAVYLGRHVGVSEATVEDKDGRTMAHATTRCVVMDFPFDPDAELPGRRPPIEEPPDPYLRDVPEGFYQDPALLDGEKIPTMQRLLSGELPPSPIEHLTGVRYQTVEEGKVTLTWPASPWFSAGGPAMYGGATAWACDTAVTAALWSTLDPASIIAPLDLQVRYLRPVFLDGTELTAVGDVRHVGRTIRVGHADVFDSRGKRVAVATGSGMVVADGIERLKSGHSTEHILDLEE